MRLKPAIEKYIVPALTEQGFEYEQLGKEYTFKDEENLVSMTIDTDPRWPFMLRVEYFMRGSYQFFISLDKLNSTLCPINIAKYETQAELDDILKQIGPISSRAVIPWLRKLNNNCVMGKERLYSMLADNTSKRAEAFAEKYSIPFVGGKDTLLKIDEVFYGLQPENIELRVEAFEKNLEDIVGLTAFYGEVVNLSRANERKGRWGWTTPIEPINFPNAPLIPPRYGLFFRQGEEDCMERVRYAWNFSPEVKNINLGYFDFLLS